MAYMQDLIWSELLLKQDFTTLGAARLSQDLNAIERLAPEDGVDLRKLRQGVILLNLPVVAEAHSDFTLSKASTAIYSTNAETDETLKLLGLDQLSRADARAILARRIEVQE